MKPIYIKMSAFGSYAGEEIVDFTEVNHGIFLITGDTGAGKTTIFDAITYALYDQTSGGKRDGEMMRSQYAKEEIRTYVELKFIYKGEIYTITRYPKQNRISKKRNKDGEYTLTVDAPSVELILPDGLPYKGKLKETNQKIAEIIGLDVNQFTQIAMIAQGDFLKLLHAPSNVRKEIFAKIFITRIYWRIEEELKLRSRALSGKLEDNRKDILREIENVQYLQDSRYKEQWKEKGQYSESNPEELLDLLLHMNLEATEKEAELTKTLRDNQEELDQIQASIQQAKDLNKLFEALDKAVRTEEELRQQKDEMKLIKNRIELAKKASIIEPKEQLYLSKRKDLEECGQRIRSILEWLDNHVETLKQLKLLKDQSELEYNSKNPELTSRINKINELLPKYEQYEEKKLLRATLEEQKDKVVSELEHLIHKLKQLQEQQEANLLLQAELKQVSDQIPLLQQSVERLSERKNALTSLLNSIRILQKLNLNKKQIELEYVEMEGQYERKLQAYEEIYHHFIEGQAGFIAATLAEGCPCPVCGSTSHPHKADQSATVIGQQELQAAKKQMEAAEKAKKDKYESLQGARQSFESQKKLVEHEGEKLMEASFQADQITEDELQAMLNEVMLQLKEVINRKTSAEAAKNKYDQNELEQKRLGEELKKLITSKEATEQALKQLELAIVQADTLLLTWKEALIYENKQAAKEELAASSDQIQSLEKTRLLNANRYQDLLQRITEKQGNHKTEEGAHARLSEELNRVEESFRKELMLQGFSREEEYRCSLMKQQELEQLLNRYQSYRDEVIKNQENLKNYKEQTDGKSRINTDEMEERKVTLDDRKAWLEEQSKAIYGVRTRNELIHQKIGKLLDLRKEVKEEYLLMNRLDATANGKLSLCHMNFQTYIQRKYFKSILKEANKRLYQMSNGQFILQCRDVKELAGLGEVGLDLDIYSMVNDQTRDVKTISGGESFIAAIAMALGMADIIQNTAGSIHIDTMFIDEGFGSLSDETRSQAIHILNSLSEGRRLVGIISHVSELKAQIGTKLLVTKSEKGSSVRWDIRD